MSSRADALSLRSQTSTRCFISSQWRPAWQSGKRAGQW